MKNLFDYATKELTQDAFLRWLFENHDDAELGKPVYELLKEFCEFADDEKIKSLVSISQEHKIDLSFYIETTTRRITLFIEDKTFSNEHRQLEKYDTHIERPQPNNIYKIFYKTNLISDVDEQGISQANNHNTTKWVAFDINKIVSVFGKYSNSQNQILAQYAQYVKKISDCIHNTQKPKTNSTKSDLIEWQAYFNNTVIPNLHNDKCTYGVWKAGRFPYICLVITKKGYDKRVPYLEIRSKDCYNDRFQARILCYDVLYEDLKAQQSSLIANIKDIKEWNCKGLVTKHNGKQIYPKQVGYSDIENATNDNQFISLVEKYISLYLQTMIDWE